MKTSKLSISISDMNSAHCMNTVSSGIREISGVTINKIEPGLLIVEADDSVSGSNVTSKIASLGYTVTGIAVEQYQNSTLAFKSNIKCAGCVAQVTPFLDKLDGISHWEVDIKNPDKTLTVISHGATAQEIEDAVKQSGFQTQLIQ